MLFYNFINENNFIFIYLQVLKKNMKIFLKIKIFLQNWFNLKYYLHKKIM